MSITDRYASAINSKSLVVDERTTFSDSDVLGAMGLADKALVRGQESNGNPIKPVPLAVPLTRLLCGDNKASTEIVQILSEIAFEKSWRLKVKIQRVECLDMARACLAWFRDSVCKPCGGHGRLKIPGTNVIGSVPCKPCKGLGRVRFETAFKPEHRQLAQWLEAEMQKAQAYAGPQAMKSIASSMDF